MYSTTKYLAACAILALGCDDATSTGVPPSADAGKDAQSADARALDATALDAAGDARIIDAQIDAEASDGAIFRDDASPTIDPDSGLAPDGALPVDMGMGAREFLGTYPIDAEFTEGGAYDPVEHAFYASSLASGGVYRIDAQTGAQATLYAPADAVPAEPGVWWTLGMAVDVVDHMLYVCAMDDRRELDEDYDYAGYLWGFDLQTEERVIAIPLSDAAPGATCTDVALGENGRVFINDRENPRLYVYSAERGVSLLVQDDELSGRVVGQNALVVLPDQSAILSLIYLPSRLVRVSLPDLVVTEVEINGDFFDGIPALSGADGMVLTEDGLLVMFTSQLNRLRPVLADWSSAESTTIDVPGGMTDVVHTPGGDYLLNGQAVDFALGRDPDPAQLVRFEGEL